LKKIWEFDRYRLKIEPLRRRISDLNLRDILPLEKSFHIKSSISEVAKRIKMAKEEKAAIILMIGGHVIRSGVQRYLIDLMRRGYISCMAMNGAGIIHDYEYALIGETTESVRKYIREGQFGLWEETGKLNVIINEGYRNNLGMGEAVGRAIVEGVFPHEEISLLAAGYRLQIPITVHVGIGYDIIHEHPNCDGAALGGASYRDFLAIAHTVSQLEGGVMLCYGSAVMGPEVYLKALSMARNVARQEGEVIAHFTTAVFDLIHLGDDLETEAPKSDPRYYYRPFKTILVRTVRDGGTAYYVEGDHAKTLPNLRARVLAKMGVTR